MYKNSKIIVIDLYRSKKINRLTLIKEYFEILKLEGDETNGIKRNYGKRKYK